MRHSEAVSFLLRVVLPDRPGSLGLVAGALGTVGADIVSLDVIERRPGYAVDDLVVELPQGRLPDSMISAIVSVAGVKVESIRPYAAAFDTNRELELIDALIENPDAQLGRVATGVTRIFRAGWTLVLGAPDKHADADHIDWAPVLAGCAAAPEVTGVHAPWWPLTSARTLNDAHAVDAAWSNDNTEVAISPLGEMAVVVGRPATPWLPGELARLRHLAGIIAGVLDRAE